MPRTLLALLLALPALAAAADPAATGQPAPDFTLQDLDGKAVQLSALRGKVVVLEWFNPQCPFVVASHTRGSLVGLADRLGQQGVVWLAVNSAAPGKQGYGPEVNREGAARFKLAYPILLDPEGTVGRAYGATNTPHLFVIDARGTLAYRGGIDNSPDGERGAPEGGHLVEYVSEAVADLAAGRPVRTPSTKAYGCSVKYASR
ncbi:MAG: thioredoxin family protein [Anaeromyxobacter sp.]